MYCKDYNKQQISNLMKESREEIALWLERALEVHYLVIYSHATFVHTRRNKSVHKEGYFTILGIKENRSRVVLSIVNPPYQECAIMSTRIKAFKN
jgi:putative transposase